MKEVLLTEATMTVATLMETMGTIFTTSIGWVGEVAQTVANEPLLLMGVIFGFAFVGVGLFKRLLSL